MPPLISAILGIIELSGLQSEVRSRRHFSESPFEYSKPSCEILIVEIEPVLLEKMSLTMKTSHNNFDFFEPGVLANMKLIHG